MLKNQTESEEFIVIGQALDIELDSETDLATGNPTFVIEIVNPVLKTLTPVLATLVSGSTTKIKCSIAPGVLNHAGKWTAQIVTPAAGANRWCGVPHFFTVRNRFSEN